MAYGDSFVKIAYSHAYGNLCTPCAIEKHFDGNKEEFLRRVKGVAQGTWIMDVDGLLFYINRQYDLDILEEYGLETRNFKCSRCDSELYVYEWPEDEEPEHGRWDYAEQYDELG